MAYFSSLYIVGSTVNPLHYTLAVSDRQLAESVKEVSLDGHFSVTIQEAKPIEPTNDHFLEKLVKCIHVSERTIIILIVMSTCLLTSVPYLQIRFHGTGHGSV